MSIINIFMMMRSIHLSRHLNTKSQIKRSCCCKTGSWTDLCKSNRQSNNSNRLWRCCQRNTHCCRLCIGCWTGSWWCSLCNGLMKWNMCCKRHRSYCRLTGLRKRIDSNCRKQRIDHFESHRQFHIKCINLGLCKLNKHYWRNIFSRFCYCQGRDS